MSDGNEPLQEATWALFSLCINLGLINSVIDQYPEEVQDGFRERLGMVQEWAEQQIEETQAFGEAFDETEGEDET